VLGNLENKARRSLGNGDLEGIQDGGKRAIELLRSKQLLIIFQSLVKQISGENFTRHFIKNLL
jgi:hypothetical protein